MRSLMLFHKKNKNKKKHKTKTSPKIFAVVLMAESYMTCPSFSQVSLLKLGCCMQVCPQGLFAQIVLFSFNLAVKTEIINSMYWVHLCGLF